MLRCSLAGKIALVTGGSRGIGRAIAIELAEAGADVAITYRERESEALATAREIAARGRRTLVLKADVTDRGSIEDAARRLRDDFGRLSVLVNNAGVNRPTDFDRIEDQDWDFVLSTNLKGPFICTQVFLPLLIEAAQASIVNIGSVSGQYGGPRTAHYAASKAGLISLTQVIARFGAPHGIRANTVAAGLIGSDMAQSALSAPSVQKAAEGILLKRLGSPREIADPVVFLASDAASYITGQTLAVNGGLYF